MSKVFITVVIVLLATSLQAADEKPKAGYAKKDGLSLTAALDKKTYDLADEVVLRFALKNVSEKVLYVGDGFLAPDYHEAGPGRHFEVHVKSDGKNGLYFWSGMATEGSAAGICRVFMLKPGEEYKGAIRLSAGAVKDKKSAEGGSFEDKASRKPHVLGQNGRRYTVELRYQVDPKTDGVWKPPTDFKDELLWKGELTSAPLEFEMSAKK